MRFLRAMSEQTSVKPWLPSLKSGGRTAYQNSFVCLLQNKENVFKNLVSCFALTINARDKAGWFLLC